MRHARLDYQEFIQDVKLEDGEIVQAGLIPDDEPVFLLRGQDPFASILVGKWISLAKQNNLDPKLIAVAELQRERMESWQPKKMPDAPAEVLEDVEIPVVEETVEEPSPTGKTHTTENFTDPPE